MAAETLDYTSGPAKGPTGGGNVVTRIRERTLQAIASANDVYQMIKVPLGGKIIDGWLKMYSSGAYTVTVGDGGSTARFVPSCSVSGTATFIRFGALAGGKNTIPYTYAAEDTIDIKTTAVPASTAGLILTLCVKYITEDQNA